MLWIRTLTYTLWAWFGEWFGAVRLVMSIHGQQVLLMFKDLTFLGHNTPDLVGFNVVQIFVWCCVFVIGN